LARTVEDTAITLAVMAKHDERDSTSLPESVRYKNNDLDTLIKNLKSIVDLKNTKIGVIEELTSVGNQIEVSAAIDTASKTFRQLGATIDTVSIPRAKNALPVYYILATAEASANLARYDGVRYGYRDRSKNDVLNMYLSTRQNGFGPEVKRRIMLGTYVLSSGYYDAYYKKAQQVRRLLSEDFQNIFAKYDLVICPTSPSVAFKLGERTDDPLQMYLSDIASIPANLAGLPAISLPCGFGKNNMPIGLQLMGAPLSDAKLLQVAYAFEQATKFHQQYPAILLKTLAATQH
jgi:aspartyl-tRNA(Asn)/glutamyl-tRNA(Gln) amidotransferase subunit A